MMNFYDRPENFHPYECDGIGKCRHCDRVKTDDHDPATCALCDDGTDVAEATVTRLKEAPCPEAPCPEE